MEKFSISRVNTYLDNPWKHWCKYIAKYKPKYDPEYNKYMDRGTVFHKVMEEITKGEPVNTAKALAIAEATQSGFTQEAKDCGILAFERYQKENGLTIPTTAVKSEYKLIYPISDTAEFIGFIDAIVENEDGTVTLVDYKTYSNAPQEPKLKYSLQANMYMYVAKQLGFNVKSFMFDCVNPKAVLKGRAYKTKRIKFNYNPNVAQEMFEQFCMAVETIQKFPEFKMYVPGDYLPDMYDTLYKVWVGDITEDLDEFVEKYFEPMDEEEDED